MFFSINSAIKYKNVFQKNIKIDEFFCLLVVMAYTSIFLQGVNKSRKKGNFVA